jgi:hypothetical protein
MPSHPEGNEEDFFDDGENDEGVGYENDAFEVTSSSSPIMISAAEAATGVTEGVVEGMGMLGAESHDGEGDGRQEVYR